jgi:hypothetical protein
LLQLLTVAFGTKGCQQKAPPLPGVDPGRIEIPHTTSPDLPSADPLDRNWWLRESLVSANIRSEVRTQSVAAEMF